MERCRKSQCWLNEFNCFTDQKFFLFLLCRFVIKTTSLNNLVINIKLVPSPLVHGLFDTLLRNEAKDENNLCLPNAMRTILGLQISMRIPITVKSTVNLAKFEIKSK